MTVIEASVLERPYKGLAPFEDTALDAMLFFGRERESEVIASNLVASRLTVLYGPSGVGKTSVLRAGVAYRLRQAAEGAIRERGHPDAAVVVFDDWRGDPERALRTAVEAALGRLFGSLAVPAVPPDGTLSAALRRWTDELDVDLLLVLDQFEEYFVYHRPGDAFATTLADALADSALRVHVLLSLREDALSRLDRFKGRIPNLFSNYLRLDRLSPAAARRASRGPLERYNERAGPLAAVEIEDALVEAIVEQTAAGRVDLARRSETANGARGGGVEPAYLQLVLARVWDEEAGASRRLRASTLAALGGAGAIVRNHIVGALDGLDDKERDVAATLVHHLVTPSGTKIAHSLADLERYVDAAPERVDGVVAGLARERVLRPVALPAEDGASAVGYEIYHDVLAEPLLAWRAEHREARRLEHQRQAAARRQRVLATVAGVAVVVAVLMAGVTAYALAQRSEADRQARIGLGRELAARAFAALDTDPELSVLLAVEAAKRTRGPEVEDALRAALLRSRARDVVRVRPRAVPVEGARLDVARLSRNGRLLVTTLSDETAGVYETLTGRVVQRLEHGARVTAAAFGPYADLVLTGDADGVARLWRITTGELVAEVAHGAALTAVALAAGPRVATAGADRRLRVWYAGQAPGMEWEQPLAGVAHAIAFGARGDLVAPVVRSGDVPVFEAGTGVTRAALAHGGRVTAVVFAPGGRIVTTGSNRVAKLWTPVSGARPLRTFGGHDLGVTAAAVSPGRKYVATGSLDGAVRIFDAASGHRVGFNEGHRGAVATVAFDPDGKRVVSAGSDDAARVYEAATGRLLAELVGHRGGVTAAAFTSDGRAVVTTGDDGTVRVWDPAAEPQLELLGEHPEVTTASFSRRGGRALSAGADGRVRVWDVRRRRLLATLAPGGDVRVASFAPDGRTILTAGTRGTQIWQSGAGRPRWLTGSPTVDAAFVGAGTHVAAADVRGVVRVFDARSGRRLQRKRHAAGVGDLAVSRDGRQIALAGVDGALIRWARATGTWNVRRGAHRGAVVRVSFSPDSKLVATAGKDGAAAVWRSAGGAPLHRLGRHDAPLTDVAFARDGAVLVTAAGDGDGQLWAVRSGRRVGRLEGHVSSVASARFSGDGRWIVTAGPGAAGLWTRDGAFATFLRGHGGPLAAATFAPRGYRVLTVGAVDGTVRTYRCRICGDVRALVGLARERVHATGRRLTAAERRAHLHEGR